MVDDSILTSEFSSDNALRWPRTRAPGRPGPVSVYSTSCDQLSSAAFSLVMN